MGEERVGFPSDFFYYYFFFFRIARRKCQQREGVYIVCMLFTSIRK